jgi:hypothetical protein
MTVKNRYQDLQTMLKHCGYEGCHFLALCSIIEEVNQEPVDLIEAIKVCQSKGFIDYNFFVKAGDSLLEYFTGKKWSRRKVEVLPPVIKDNEYTEAIYYNPRTEYYHYRRRGFDTVIDSVTVKEGYIIGYYIWYYKE